MKKFLLGLLLCIATACGICRHYTPKETEITKVHVIDSVAWHDSTVYHHIYKEHYNDYKSLLDTLSLETFYSEFRAYIDTTNKLLKGEAQNKEGVAPVDIRWKEKIVYKDSIQTKEIPVPIEITKEVTKYPKSYWWLLGFTLISLAYIALKIYFKVKLGKII